MYLWAGTASIIAAISLILWLAFGGWQLLAAGCIWLLVAVIAATPRR